MKRRREESIVETEEQSRMEYKFKSDEVALGAAGTMVLQ